MIEILALYKRLVVLLAIGLLCFMHTKLLKLKLTLTILTLTLLTFMNPKLLNLKQNRQFPFF